MGGAVYVDTATMNRSTAAAGMVEAELLGSALMHEDVYFAAAEKLTRDDFVYPLHQAVWDAMTACVERCEAPAVSVVVSMVRDHPDITSTENGSEQLAKLLSSGLPRHIAVSLVDRVASGAVARRMFDAGYALSNWAASDEAVRMTPEEIVDEAERLVAERAPAALQRVSTQPIASHLDAALDAAAEAYEGTGRRYVRLPLPSLARIVGPLAPGDLLVVGGATSMGKTALAFQQAITLAASYATQAGERGEEVIAGARVAAFSLEMSAIDIINRELAYRAKVDVERIEEGRFSPEEYQILREQSDLLRAVPFYLDQTSGLTVSQMRARCQRLQRTAGGLDVVLIDHLGFIGDDLRFNSREEALDERVTQAKRMARDLGVIVVLISHLNRELRNRTNKRPQLHDLFGSSAVEKHADAVLFVHREEYWLVRDRPAEGTAEYLDWEVRMEQWRNKAELIVAKRRRGRGADIATVHFDGAFTRFSELAHD